MTTIVENTYFNQVYEHVWRTVAHGLPVTVMAQLDEICTGKWGYHFEDSKFGLEFDLKKTHFYASSILCLSFEDNQDLVQAKLSLPF